MDHSGERAKSRSYYHTKVAEPMRVTAPSTGQEHPLDAASLVTTKRYATHDKTVDESREQFAGYGRTAQVLRWISSAALKHSPKGGASFTEVQAGFTGKRLILGSNANIDPLDPLDLTHSKRDATPIQSALKTALTSGPVNATGVPADEGGRIELQKNRHINQLQSFVHNDEFFNAFVDKAVGEAQGSRKQATRRQLTGIRKSLQHVETGVANGFKAFDAGHDGATKNSPNYHAEQRVLDHAIEHHDELMDEVAAAKGIDKARIHKMRMTVAGTKPPCHRCRTTEEQRGALEAKDQSKLKVYRFETDSGGFFPTNKFGATFSRHPTVEARTTTELKKDLDGTGSSIKHKEPMMPTLLPVTDSHSFARARRDSVAEIIPVKDGPSQNLGRK